MNNFIDKLKEIVDLPSIIFDLNRQRPYLTDWRERYYGQCIAVILPNTINQISQIVKLCQEYSIGIVPQGGNTSLCGGATPINGNPNQIILNLTNLNKIINLDLNNNSLTVEAGCTLKQVRDIAKKHNLDFPLSIASEGSCQIGGNIATNAGGIHVIKYGTMRELVLGIEAILPDGTLVNQLNSLRKNNLNFDLKQLFIGSEGTLGIITKAVLKLSPIPHDHFTCLLGVNDFSQIYKILNNLIQSFSVCAFEIINQTIQKIYNTQFENSINLSAKWLILFELESLNTKFDPLEVIKVIEHDIDLNNAIWASNQKERDTIWQYRENIPIAEKKYGIAIKHDIALPISTIDNFIEVNQKNLLTHFPKAQIGIFGHFGDGNLHYNVFLDSSNISDYEEKINQIVYKDVMAYKGSFSAEHGVGQLKKIWFYKYHDRISYNLAKSIKQMIDPHQILNPGKIF